MARSNFGRDIEPVLFDALAGEGVTSYAELALVTGFPLNRISGYLSHLRHHAVEYGWTVPHVPRGRNRINKRLFAVFLDPEGEIDPDTVTFAHSQSLTGGTIGTLEMIRQLGINQGTAILAYPKNGIVDRRTQARLQEIHDDLLYIARKAATIIPMMAEAVNG